MSSFVGGRQKPLFGTMEVRRDAVSYSCVLSACRLGCSFFGGLLGFSLGAAKAKVGVDLFSQPVLQQYRAPFDPIKPTNPENAFVVHAVCSRPKAQRRGPGRRC